MQRRAMRGNPDIAPRGRIIGPGLGGRGRGCGAGVRQGRGMGRGQGRFGLGAFNRVDETTPSIQNIPADTPVSRGRGGPGRGGFWQNRHPAGE